ncbi:MAG: hypothetical protein IJT41_02370 [Clostridia bacterium]|nr:hypothetical protein [Clostridia bacterium]
MNELSQLFAGVKSGDTLTLERGRVYAIAPEDSFYLTGLYFSNTAKRDENPHGERFCGMYLENLRDVTIDGGGATVLIHGIMTPFIFKACQNIRMRNLTIDHFRPTMSEMTVVESAPGEATVRIQPEFLYRIEDGVLFWQSEPSASGAPYWEIPYKGPKVLTNAFDPHTGIIGDMLCGEGDARPGFPDVTQFTPLGGGLVHLRFRDTKKYLAPGTVAQARCIRRVQTGGAIDDCAEVTLENLRIHSMNCFGILAQNSRDVTYDAIECVPKAGRTVVSDADFFHFSGCSGAVRVQNCRAMGAHDDIINIHGTHLRIVEADRIAKTLLLRYSHPESWGFNPYVPGDRIEYVSGDTLLPFGEAVVTDVRKVNDTDFRAAVDAIPDRPFAPNDVVENVTRTASLTVENNVFERIPSRAILCTTRQNVVIRGNTFRCMGAPALCVADDANFWFESGRTGTIRFENNTVIDCGARETDSGCDVIRYEPVVLDKTSDTPVHDTLIVRGNRFENTLADRYTINLNYVRCAQIENNTSNVTLCIRRGKGVQSVQTEGTISVFSENA